MPSYSVATLFMGRSCGGANIETRLVVHKILPSHIDAFYGDSAVIFLLRRKGPYFFRHSFIEDRVA